MRGRKPKPTRLKLLEGNAGHRPINGREPEPTVSGLREPPDYITGDARAFWFAQGPGLVQMQTLSDVDFPRFEDLCLRHEEKVRLIREISRLRKKKKLKAVEKVDLQTFESQHRKASAQFAQFAAEFGIGASSRTRIKLPDGQLPLPGMGMVSQPQPTVSPLDRSKQLSRGA
jgi:phage terminase small subunit